MFFFFLYLLRPNDSISPLSTTLVLWLSLLVSVTGAFLVVGYISVVSLRTIPLLEEPGANFGLSTGHRPLRPSWVFLEQ